MYKKRDPFFSILIASLNAKNQLICCLASIQQQDFDDYEILISDGGSTDGTTEYIKSAQLEHLSWYKSALDGGIYDALNIAIEHATGSWILVLGSDDRLVDSETLGRAASYINNNSAVGIFYSNLFICNSKNIKIKKYPEISRTANKCRNGPIFHHQSVFMARHSIINAGGFSKKYHIHADYDLMLTAYKKDGAIKIEDAFVVFNSQGFSSKLGRLFNSYFEIYAIRKSHGYSPTNIRIIARYIKLFFQRILFG